VDHPAAPEQEHAVVAQRAEHGADLERVLRTAGNGKGDLDDGDVRPGEEIRDGGVRAQVQAEYRVGRR